MTKPFSLTWRATTTRGRIECNEAPLAIQKRAARFYDVVILAGAHDCYGLNTGPQGMIFHTMTEAKNWCHRIERNRRIDTEERDRRPSELTPEGEQYVIPGAERRNTGSPPVQSCLFDA